MAVLNKHTRILVITGGVFSSLGKGITASSIARLLQNTGFKVINLKFDPYVNVDPGTMSPLQHGEVFVTADGGETDLDLGNYERFSNINLSKLSNLTTGAIYQNVIKKERNGDYLGKTVQIIPHITDAIIDRVIEVSNKTQPTPDFLIIEIGGTVGDIESIPFIEAMRQLGIKYPNRVQYFHCVPLINLLTSDEAKTKPLQHSVRELMHAGISPDFLLVRSKKGMSSEDKRKIFLTSGVNEECLIDVKNQAHVFDLPTDLHQQNLHQLILNKFKIKTKIDDSVLNDWNNFLTLLHKEPKYNVKIAIVGKYVSNEDAYLSLTNGLQISGWYEETDVKITLINALDLKENNYQAQLKDFDAIIVPGGFGESASEGKMLAIQYARENKVPYLGICLGMQLACIEFAKNVLHFVDATSEEFDSKAKNKIIYLIPGKKKDANLGGTLRLGSYLCSIKPHTLAAQIYQVKEVLERHRHRYEFNNAYKDAFEQAGVVFSGMYLANQLVEIVELKKELHPFFIATQFHPEFTAKTLKPQPLFSSLIKQAKKLIKK